MHTCTKFCKFVKFISKQYLFMKCIPAEKKIENIVSAIKLTMLFRQVIIRVWENRPSEKWSKFTTLDIFGLSLQIPSCFLPWEADVYGLHQQDAGLSGLYLAGDLREEGE